LYKAIARIAEEDYLEVEVAQKLRGILRVILLGILRAIGFLLSRGQQSNPEVVNRPAAPLGLSKLSFVGGHGNHKPFLLIPCCQRLLAELWHGSLRVRSVTFVTMSAITVDPAAGNRSQSLSAMAKMRAFYSAPITKFWSWCIAFVIFLMLSSYVLLIETPVNPTNIEYATLAYIVVYTVEHIRKVSLFDQETPKLREKCRVFYTKYYNLLTATALLLFLVGFGFRMQPSMRHSYGRVILSCSNVLWYMKVASVLEYLSVHPLLGPYIQMAAKMVISMCYIIVLLLVTLMAFGVSRQAITYPHEKWNWLLVRNIFYKPYFMLYGEVYAGEIDTCGDEGKSFPFRKLSFIFAIFLYNLAWKAFRKGGTSEGTNCVPGGWIPPVLMTIFLLVANILLINMLIAIFNNIFNDTNIRSHEVWLFQRYGQEMEYNDTPLLPPPFTILAYITRLLCFFSKKKPLKTGKERDDVVAKCSMRVIPERGRVTGIA
ncbi:transporter, cation channel family protein, partial [Ostertagia ostertagi]